MYRALAIALAALLGACAPSQSSIKPTVATKPAFGSAEAAYRALALIGRDDRSLRIDGSLSILDRTWQMAVPVEILLTTGNKLHLVASLGLETFVDLVTNGNEYQLFIPRQAVIFAGTIDRCVFASAIGTAFSANDVRAVLKGGVPLLTRPSELNLERDTLTLFSFGFREIIIFSPEGLPLSAELYGPHNKLVWKVTHDRNKETNTQPRLPKFTVVTDGRNEHGFRLRRGRGTAWDTTTRDPFHLKDVEGVRHDSLSCR